ncbi:MULTISPECIES: contractile injection system protein, VgrG/Pvc8 family [unclassified Undibacterium]|uniref:contractile injection system protein, VgrG/Pvc8 family n=1 Tax=unclassified Undibacterium TaxID=2630295 RepID=UPI002AC91D5F|nr:MULTISPECIES: contractile injection system protein, VgrG/Pvc8 family [unclassified Undibacterium]MEB0137981.1 contractile injection system protein, VgrG/Pvc8 family [Undibacterium sp. CCC2.1]MEB0170686.1 contractile injection system protein, VgrG/Pvc8 family [Undibacterium sp. CCC1.1]MEB0177027.1 contractile injection system protein, VgrG/Pvc8 family [Undibacterium sp. CCC3.4]MEB0216316.1 contractile injection system protein, VgrG/Pvc8 family [Undibacterium sp. 5I2]WPX42500.1 contractile in
MSHPQAAFKITLDEQDLTARIAPRLLSLTLSEASGDDSDQLDLQLDDADGQLALPPRGATIRLQIGWAESGQSGQSGGAYGLIDKGSFTVDEIEHSGAPDTLTLRARTANLIDQFRLAQDNSFHATTLGSIIELIAFRNELAAGIAESLRDILVAHVDQTRESDAAFLRRLGKQYDAVATVKNHTLLFLPINQSRALSGKELAVIRLNRHSGDSHRYHSAEREHYSGVRAFWYDSQEAMRRSVVAGAPGNSKRLRSTYATPAEARQAAQAEWQRQQRGLATLELTLALGNPALMPQSPVIVNGYKDEIDQTAWLAVKVSHQLSAAGFTTRLELATLTAPADTEGEGDDQADTDPDPDITGVAAKWHDSISKNQGRAIAGAGAKLKTLTYSYASKQSAQRAANLEWAKIRERREMLLENQRGDKNSA